MAAKRLLAFVGVGLLVIGTLAAAVAVSGPSLRVSVARTGAATPLRTRAGGRGEAPLDATGPSVAYTPGLLNNTLIPGNFLAGNEVRPAFVAYDSGKGEVFVSDLQSNHISVISDTTNTVRATTSVGTAPLGVAYDGAKGEVFVANQLSSNVSVISDTSNAVVATIPVGNNPFGVASDSREGEGLDSNNFSTSVSVISAA